MRREARRAEHQRRCEAALERKCSILWSLLDAVEQACDRPLLVAHAQLRFDKPENAWLVVLPERAIQLGGSGHAILERCDGLRSGETIVEELRALEGASDEVEEEVYGFLEEMERLGATVRLHPGESAPSSARQRDSKAS